MAKTPFYKADDQKLHFKRPSKAKLSRVPKIRKSITPGTVLILLAGKFRGRRVVFLKALESGLLLVTGPYRVNGVPLKRVNQAYVIATSTKVALPTLDLSKITDKSFGKTKEVKDKKKRQEKASELFVQKNELTDAEKKKIDEKKKNQKTFDEAIIAAIKKDDLLRRYMKTRFTIRKGTRPHEMIF